MIQKYRKGILLKQLTFIQDYEPILYTLGLMKSTKLLRSGDGMNIRKWIEYYATDLR